MAIIVENSQGRVLLLLRDNKPDLEFANYWTLPGGLVEGSETPAEAASRELREETGLDLALSLWKVYERRHQRYDLTIEQHVFVGHTDRERPSLRQGEGQDLCFWSCKDLVSLPVAYGFGRLLEEYFTKATQC